MPSEPIPWDRMECFKASKEARSDSVGSEDSRSHLRKRPVEAHGVLLKNVRLDHALSQPAEKILEDASIYQFRNKLCCSPVCDEICNRVSQVPGIPKDLTLDVSTNLLAEKSCNASRNYPLYFSHHESASVSEGRIFVGDMDKSLADGLQHSSNQGHSDYSVGLARNPIRWMRSESLSSRESGLSYSIGSKSMSVNVDNSQAGFPKHNLISCQSASGDTYSCATPSTPSEGTSPWKRPRLKWGEGLAKFEKKSTVTDDAPNKNEAISCTLAQLSGCASPATPTSAACSAPPGSEGKPFTNAVVGSNGNNLSHTLVSEAQKHFEDIPFSEEKVDLSIFTDAGPSLIEMMNSGRQLSENPDSTSSSVMNKLLLLKSEILKAVDMTDSQMDLLENELKPINNKSGHNDCRCLASEPPAIELIKVSGQVPQDTSDMSRRPALPLHESADTVVVKVPVDSGNSEVLKADIVSSRTVTSKLVEQPFTEPHVVSVLMDDGDSLNDFDASRSPQEVQKSSKLCSHGGKMSNVCVNGAVVSYNSSLIDERVVDTIWASNREYANKAYENLNIVYPVAKTIEDYSNDGHLKGLLIRKLIVKKKKALQFKEQAVALKWRAIYSSWKDDMPLFSVRNHCSKAQKKWEIISRTTLNNHPSVRSKSLHAKKSSVDVGKLLSIFHLKPCKGFLKMPALILNGNEKRTCIFLSSNGLVEDPCAAEKERSMINSWTSEERETFMDKLVSHGKDFRKIASFLDHKTTADCVQFYYKNHKSESFAKTIKKQDRGMSVKSLSNSTYLVTRVKKWDITMDTASLDVLGAASELVARNIERKENKKRNTCGLLQHDVGRTRPPRKDVLFPYRTSDLSLAKHEIRTSDNEFLPGECGSLSPEAISSCITSTSKPGEGNFNRTPKTFSIISKPPSIPEDILIDGDETCSDESSCELDVGYWTDIEKSVFVRAVQSYGKDFCMVSRCIGTKSKYQCKSFYSKVRKCLVLDLIHPDKDHEQQSVISGSNGDKSAPVLTSTQETVSDSGDHKVNQGIHEDTSLSVSVTSNVDSLSPDAGITSHSCHDKLKDKEGNLENPCADLNVECQFLDKPASNPHLMCVGNNPTMSNDADKQTFPSKYSVSVNKPVDISPSLSFNVPSFESLAQFGKEKSSMEPPLLLYHVGENGSTPVDIIQNKVSCLTEDRGMQKAPFQRSADNQAPFQRSADNQPPVGSTAGVSRQMCMSNGVMRGVTSQNRLAYRTSFGLLNSNQKYIAGLPTPDISFVRNSLGEARRHFQESQHAVNHAMHQTHVPSNQFHVSQSFKKQVDNESAWNLNFEDSTMSRRGSCSDSENGFPSCATIPLRGYVQMCDSLNSNPLVTELSYFKESSHCSRNQMINSAVPEKQGKQANFKLFGQVLVPSTAPATHSTVESKCTQYPSMNFSPVGMTPLNHCSINLGSENVPVRSFWDGCLMQTVPLLAGCPIPLSYDKSSPSVLDRQPLQTAAVPAANAPPTIVSTFDNSLNRSMKLHIPHTATTRRDL